MTFPRARLAVSAALFLGWLGFLAYLVFNTSDIVLSRPQFLLAQVVAVGEIPAGSTQVRITDVLWAAHDSDRKLVDQTLDLPEVADAVHARGPGVYLLPLQKLADGRFEIAPLPRDLFMRNPTHATIESTGVFSHQSHRRMPIAKAEALKSELVENKFEVSYLIEEIRIYPFNRHTRAQIDEFIRARSKAQ